MWLSLPQKHTFEKLISNVTDFFQNNRQTLFDKLYRNYFVTYRNYFPTYIKLLTTTSVDCLQGHDFWKETLLMSLSNVFLGAMSTTIREPFTPIILEKRQKFYG